MPVRARPVRSRREIRAEGHASAGIPIRPRWYTGACSGHDEPELDPVSSAPGSAQDLTWTAILPKDGTVPVAEVGPTFWGGGTVTRPRPPLAVRPGFPGAAGLPGRHREHPRARWAA